MSAEALQGPPQSSKDTDHKAHVSCDLKDLLGQNQSLKDLVLPLPVDDEI